jgi:sulfur carrier protein ThiS
LVSHVQSERQSGSEVCVKITYRDQEWALEGRWRVRDAIKEVGLIPQTVLAVRDGKLLTGDVMLEEDDEIRLVAVISGG